MPNIDLRQYFDIRFFQYTLLRTIGAGVGTRDEAGVIKVQNDSDFIVQKIVGNSAGAYDLQIQDTGTGRNWFDAVKRNTLVVGTAQRPNVLLTPKMLRANSQQNFTLVNQQAGANRTEIVLEGIKCFKSLPAGYVPRSRIDLSRYVEQDYFGYEFLTATALGANASTTLIVNINADSDFLLQKIVGRSTGTFRMQITDTSCGLIMSDQLVDDVDIIGTAQQPNVLLRPQLVIANTTLQINITDTSAAPNTIQVMLEGTKFFLGR